MYANVNSYGNKSHLIKHVIEKSQINGTAFVETKHVPTTNIRYRDWSVVDHKGNIYNTNVRGGSILQFHPHTKMRKENAPRINDAKNDALHISIPYRDD